MVFDFTNTKFRFGRPLSSYAKVQNALAWAIRNRRILAPPLKRGAYIDVGCGRNINDHFYNIDHAWRPRVNLCWDITRDLPFADGIVGGIFTEHCVEHITFGSFLKLAREFHRVLMPGATARIIVPDGELYARRYIQREDMPYGAYDGIAGIYTPFMSINRIFYSGGHQYQYDFETLHEVLARTGFRDIVKSAFREGRDPRLLIDTERHAVESLYVEATK